MTNIAEQTLAKIVTGNYQAVPILEKYDLDYCCKGKRTLSQACIEKGLLVDDIIHELQQPVVCEVKKQMPFTDMDASQLMGYIVIHHHFYVKQSMPSILNHIDKVATKHKDHFPYMTKVLNLFNEIKEEMTTHMQKEEAILFPRIKDLEAFYHAKQYIELPENYISAGIGDLEREHDHAGAILYKIRRLTNNYTAPEGACTTFKISLQELKEFEVDLHAHVHLENNLLFPLAEKMLESIRNKNPQTALQP